MGRSRTSKYAIEMDGMTPACWFVNEPGYGKPTAENLARYVAAYARSLEPGGVNAHVSVALGRIPYPNRARIVRNDGSRAVVVEWTAPMFWAVGPAA